MVLGRLKNQDQLDPIIEAWTRERDHHEAMHILQKAGVAAGAVLTNKEVLLDPHLKARGFFDVVEYSEGLKDLGKRVLPGRPWLGSGARMGERRPAPALGQDTEMVLRDLLGLSELGIQEAEAEGITAREPRKKDAPRNLTVDELMAQGTMVDYDPDYLKRLGI